MFCILGHTVHVYWINDLQVPQYKSNLPLNAISTTLKHDATISEQYW